MRTLATLTAIAAIAVGTATTLAHAGTQTPKDRLVEMMTKLEGPQDRAYRDPQASQHWSVFNWLFNSMYSSEPDEVIETSDAPDLAPLAPTVDGGLAPNRIYKRQIGPGQSAHIKQYGAGNTARVFQSN